MGKSDVESTLAKTLESLEKMTLQERNEFMRDLNKKCFEFSLIEVSKLEREYVAHAALLEDLRTITNSLSQQTPVQKELLSEDMRLL